MRLQPTLLVVLLAWLPHGANAGPVTCAVDAATDRHYCVDTNAVTDEGTYRGAQLYEGGPKQIERSSITAHADCRAQVLVLKDRQGVKFSGGRFSDTPLARDLGKILCSATPRRPKKNQ